MTTPELKPREKFESIRKQIDIFKGYFNIIPEDAYKDTTKLEIDSIKQTQTENVSKLALKGIKPAPFSADGLKAFFKTNYKNEDQEISEIVKVLRDSYSKNLDEVDIADYDSINNVNKGPLSVEFGDRHKMEDMIERRNDWDLFNKQIKTLSIKLKQMKITDQVSTLNLQMQPIETIMLMLHESDTYDAFGICAVRLASNKVLRKQIDDAMIEVDFFTNRAKKLNRGMISLIGYIGLYSVRDDEYYKTINSNFHNPLAGYEAVDAGVKQKPNESKEDFKDREEKHKKAFSEYKKILENIGSYKKQVKSIDADDMKGIAKNVKDWFGVE